MCSVVTEQQRRLVDAGTDVVTLLAFRVIAKLHKRAPPKNAVKV